MPVGLCLRSLQPLGDSLGGAEGLQQLVGTWKGLLGDSARQGLQLMAGGAYRAGQRARGSPNMGDPLGVAVPTSLRLPLTRDSLWGEGAMELGGAGTATVALTAQGAARLVVPSSSLC